LFENSIKKLLRNSLVQSKKAKAFTQNNLQLLLHFRRFQTNLIHLHNILSLSLASVTRHRHLLALSPLICLLLSVYLLCVPPPSHDNSLHNCSVNAVAKSLHFNLHFNCQPFTDNPLFSIKLLHFRSSYLIRFPFNSTSGRDPFVYSHSSLWV
jgi:hypothetical protein